MVYKRKQLRQPTKVYKESKSVTHSTSFWTIYRQKCMASNTPLNHTFHVSTLTKMSFLQLLTRLKRLKSNKAWISEWKDVFMDRFCVHTIVTVTVYFRHQVFQKYLVIIYFSHTYMYVSSFLSFFRRRGGGVVSVKGNEL